VVALAPDASSVAAGRKLAMPRTWSDAGASTAPAAVWGLCQGSGKTPYATVVDLAGPAFRCSCPSRKFPCKHALALLLLWAGGHVPDVAEPAVHAREWLASRAERAARTERPSTAAPDPEAAARRAERRRARVADGVADLERWLHDQVEQGLTGADRAGYGPYEQVAARLVDAQAPGLAAAVRSLATAAASGEGWPARLLDELALLHLLVRAYARLDTLDEATAAVVRRRVGEPERQQDVLAAPGLRDQWQVLAQHDTVRDRLAARRVHVRGTTTGRDAVVMLFGPSGQPLDVPLPVGAVVDADLHVHPGDPSRVSVGERHGEPAPLREVHGTTLAQVADAWSALLAVDPWATAMPVVLGDVTPLRHGDGGSARWVLADAAGDTLPVVFRDDPWRLVALSGGHPVTVVADRTVAGVRPVAAWCDGELVPL